MWLDIAIVENLLEKFIFDSDEIKIKKRWASPINLGNAHLFL